MIAFFAVINSVALTGLLILAWLTWQIAREARFEAHARAAEVTAFGDLRLSDIQALDDGLAALDDALEVSDA